MPAVGINAPTSRKIIVQKKTAANGATSKWLGRILALRGNFIKARHEFHELAPIAFASRAEEVPRSRKFVQFVSSFAVFADDVDDFRGGAFHVEDDFVHAADEVVVTRVRRNGDGNAGGRADERFPDALRERMFAAADVRVKSGFLQIHEHADERSEERR